MNEFIVSNDNPDILRITPSGTEPIIVIANDGTLFWKGREVETDSDFRSAMLDLAKALVPTQRAEVGTPRGLTQLQQTVREVLETAGDKKNSDDYIGKILRARSAELGLYVSWLDMNSPRSEEK